MKFRHGIEVAAFTAANHFVGTGVAWLALATGVSLITILSLFDNPLFLILIWLPWARAWGQPFAEFGLAVPRMPWLALAIAGGAFAALFLKNTVLEPVYAPFIETWFGGDSDAQGRDWSFLRGNTGAYLQWVVLIWLFAAIGEEVFFRGLVLRQIEATFGAGSLPLVLGIFGSSLLFGLHHAGSGVYAVINSALSAPIYCAAFLLSGRNLLAPILAHGAWDTYGLTTLYLGVD